ncbi:MAG: hypothetical protein IJ867_00455 [Clostridia bacterium]|nr:hypothetical protein [Clostridia bacterium]
MRIVAILIVSFVGLSLLIHICSKNNYEFEYSSDKRKIKIHPAKDGLTKTSKKQS